MYCVAGPLADTLVAPGDRSHIPPFSRPIFELLSTDMQRVKARAPANFQKQVIDTEKRLNILFDHLNNRDLLSEDTITSMGRLSQALQARDYEQAQGIHLDLLTHKTDQCGQWMVGTLPRVVRATANSSSPSGWRQTFDCNEQIDALTDLTSRNWSVEQSIDPIATAIAS